MEPARSLAEKYSARITLLTVMLRFPESRIRAPKMDEQSVDHGRSYLKDALTRHPLGAVPADTRVELGTPAEAIIDVAGEAGADLIVMSTHGTTGTAVAKHSLGSVAWKVLQNAPCPVYLVPVRRKADA
jgi:nucleotide-binding universal stress UspA family protein